jgi:hypothetical protein
VKKIRFAVLSNNNTVFHLIFVETVHNLSRYSSTQTD